MNSKPLRGEGPGVPEQRSPKTNYHVIASFGLALVLRPSSLPEPERIEIPLAPAFGPIQWFFHREAVRHPSKANLHLIKRLVELLSSPR